jgi:pimeloyl-ACP methyl ester carboxylesterase
MIEKAPIEGAPSIPLLLVHGAWHGAWCWEGFQDYLSENGVRSFAVNLRGHGGRPCVTSLRWTRLKEYVDDVSQAFEIIKKNTGISPVVVGHSMGGLVVQKFLESRSEVPMAILLASVPPQGVWRTTMDIALHHPLDFLMVNLSLSLWPLVNSETKAKRLFFSDTMSDELVLDYSRRLQDESYLGFLDMLAFALPKTDRISTEIAVYGGEKDVIFPPARVRDTARTYGVEPQMFPDMAHDMMLDRGWELVADRIIAEISRTQPI